jgi:hypothetical protein
LKKIKHWCVQTTPTWFVLKNGIYFIPYKLIDYLLVCPNGADLTNTMLGKRINVINFYSASIFTEPMKFVAEKNTGSNIIYYKDFGVIPFDVLKFIYVLRDNKIFMRYISSAVSIKTSKQGNRK